MDYSADELLRLINDLSGNSRRLYISVANGELSTTRDFLEVLINVQEIASNIEVRLRRLEEGKTDPEEPSQDE